MWLSNRNILRSFFQLISFEILDSLFTGVLHQSLSAQLLSSLALQVTQSDLLPNCLEVKDHQYSKVDYDHEQNDVDENPSCEGLAPCVYHEICLTSQPGKHNKDRKLVGEFKTVVKVTRIWPDHANKRNNKQRAVEYERELNQRIPIGKGDNCANRHLPRLVSENHDDH